ncbi:cell division protein FtsL [Methylobacterium sp. sgz302541]|uniref:cell division protein FtsL n=1 Tax=unclassified Methylobacterium TaxID=2615210 RepID=UPI003D32C566
MIRLLNLLAIIGLVASAIYAYSIKYDTLYQAGQVSKLKSQLHTERQAIAVLKAEWQLLTRPDRLQAAVDKHLALEPIGTEHLGRVSDLPARRERGDEIGRLLAATATATPKERPEPRTTGSIPRTTTTRTPTTVSR